MRWLPNALTIGRCVCAVLLLWGIVEAVRYGAAIEGLVSEPRAEEDISRLLTLSQLSFQFALFAFVAGAITDFMDGWLARKLDAHSRFGVWLDPIADKLLIGAALLGLALVFRSWLVYVPAAMIIARDVFMTWLRTTPDGAAVVAPSSLAKWKTAMEMLAIILLMLPPAIFRGEAETDVSVTWDVVLMAIILIAPLWCAAALSWMTAWQYIRAVRQR